MAYYLVCDGGGTKTEFLLFCGDGSPLAYARREGANATFNGIDASTAHVLDGIASCLQKAGLSPADMGEVMLFIPGFKPCKEKIERKLCRKIILEGDEKSAYYAALGQPYGIVASSGTGSFAMGRTKAGRQAKSGGWGPLFGDHGSGYHIGVLCLEKLAWLYDNGISDTRLEKLALAYLKAPDILSIRHDAYQPGYDRAFISGLCPLVAEAARQNDPYAKEILKDAALALVSDVMTVARRLQAYDLPVALTGGVSNIGFLFTDMFRSALKNACLTLVWRPSRFEPILGAALCVLTEKAHIDIDNETLINNLSKYKAGELQC